MAQGSHTHLYAGSSSAGGSATSADKVYSVVNTNSASNLPVLFADTTSAENTNIMPYRSTQMTYQPSTGSLSLPSVTAMSVNALSHSGYQVTTDTGSIGTFSSDSSYIKSLSIDKMAGAGYSSTTLTPTDNGWELANSDLFGKIFPGGNNMGYVGRSDRHFYYGYINHFGAYGIFPVVTTGTSKASGYNGYIGEIGYNFAYINGAIFRTASLTSVSTSWVTIIAVPSKFTGMYYISGKGAMARGIVKRNSNNTNIDGTNLVDTFNCSVQLSSGNLQVKGTSSTTGEYRVLLVGVTF